MFQAGDRVELFGQEYDVVRARDDLAQIRDGDGPTLTVMASWLTLIPPPPPPEPDGGGTLVRWFLSTGRVVWKDTRYDDQWHTVLPDGTLGASAWADLPHRDLSPIPPGAVAKYEEVREERDEAETRIVRAVELLDKWFAAGNSHRSVRQAKNVLTAETI